MHMLGALDYLAQPQLHRRAESAMTGGCQKCSIPRIQVEASIHIAAYCRGLQRPTGRLAPRSPSRSGGGCDTGAGGAHGADGGGDEVQQLPMAGLVRGLHRRGAPAVRWARQLSVGPANCQGVAFTDGGPKMSCCPAPRWHALREAHPADRFPGSSDYTVWYGSVWHAPWEDERSVLAPSISMGSLTTVLPRVRQQE